MKPLVVDLDGTLIKTDLLHESTIYLFRDKPFSTLGLPYWLAHGKAKLKQALAHRTKVDPSSLPYNQPLIEWLKTQKSQGRKLILCTASPLRLAQPIADYLGLFDEVMGSTATTNLAGKHKAQALVAKFGPAGFDYVGNSKADLKVWKEARKAIVVNAKPSLLNKAKALCEVEAVFDKNKVKLRMISKMLRVHQWLKNLLLFVPVFAAHQVGDPQIWSSLFLAFMAYSLCASSVYISNDLLDLENDRQHPRKKNRPFASGEVPVWVGAVLAPLLFLGAFLLGSLVPGQFLTWLVIYFVLTCAYSLGIKRVALVDCITLALLYTLRIVAGAAAADMPLSFWLLAFSVFLFLSLAFIKRYAELEVMIHSGKSKTQGRGYFTSDSTLVQTLGIAAGYGAVLILALYINSEAIISLYPYPVALWGTVPVLLYWISWMWMQAHRGLMHDDPMIFALKKFESLFALFVFALVITLGTVGIPW